MLTAITPDGNPEHHLFVKIDRTTIMSTPQRARLRSRSTTVEHCEGDEGQQHDCSNGQKHTNPGHESGTI